MWQVYTFWTCNCYMTRIEWKINSLIRRKKNHDIHVLPYKFRIAIQYKFFVYCDISIQWLVYPDTFVLGQYFWINEFSGLLNCPLVRIWKLVPALYSGLARFSDYRSPNLRIITVYCDSPITQRINEQKLSVFQGDLPQMTSRKYPGNGGETLTITHSTTRDGQPTGDFVVINAGNKPSPPISKDADAAEVMCYI